MAIIPQGDYPARAVMPTDPKLPFVRWGETKSGDPQCAITMEITQGPEKGRRLPWVGYFTPLRPGSRKSGTDMAFESLRNMGWTGNEVADITGPEHLPTEVSVKIEHEDYEVDVEGGYTETRTAHRIRFVNPLGGLDRTFKEPMTGDRLRATSARLRQAAAAHPPAGARKNAAAPRGNDAGGGRSRRADEPDLTAERSPRSEPPANPWDLTDEPGAHDPEFPDPHGDPPPR